MSKQCTKCLVIKDKDQFCKRAPSKDGLNHWCKSCVNIHNKEVIARDPEKRRKQSREWDKKNRPARFRSEIKHKFGITVEKYEKMLTIQNNSCAICGKSPEENGRRLAVDHCHITNIIRGLLCTKCNQGLGNFDDIFENLIKAANYIKLAKGVHESC